MSTTNCRYIICFAVVTVLIQVNVYARPTTVNKGYFWHVSDFHYDDTYGGSGQSCDDPIVDPGPFGNGSCDSPWLLIQDSLKNMATIKQDVDFILWTGDNAAHIPTDEFSYTRNLLMVDNVTSAINQHFPNTLAIPAFGNHDFFPADYTTGAEHEFYNTVCDMWSQWIKESEEIESCKRGGFYSVLVQPKFRVLVVNTILYLVENPLAENLTDPSGQFEWLETALFNARNACEKVIVTAHVAPTIPSFEIMYWFYPQFQDRFVNLMTNFSDVIVAHHYGHEHKDTFKILQRDDETGASPVFLAPSVTPLRGKSSTTGKYYERHNPGIRLVTYDRDTGRHLDYTQFFTNITVSNHQGYATWAALYTFSVTYQVSDMGVDSLRAIFSKMAQPYSEPMMHYCSLYDTTHTPDEVCSVKQQALYWCTGQISHAIKAVECVVDYIDQC